MRRGRRSGSERVVRELGRQAQHLVLHRRRVLEQLAARVGGVAHAERPAFRAANGNTLHGQRRVAFAERAHAFQGGHRAVEIAGEARDAHAERADGKHHVEGILLLEVDLGLGKPAGRVSVPRAQEVQAREREGRKSAGGVVVGSHGVVHDAAHVSLDLVPPVARLERDQAQGGERSRVGEVAHRYRWPRGECRRRCRVALPGQERRHRLHRRQRASSLVRDPGIAALSVGCSGESNPSPSAS